MATIIRAGAALLLAVLASGCESPSASHLDAHAGGGQVTRQSTGVVTGVATVCTSLDPPGQGRRLKVYADNGRRSVAHQWVDTGPQDTGGRYLLALRPGDYVIMAPASGDPPATVSVHAGSSATVNFPRACGQVG